MNIFFFQDFIQISTVFQMISQKKSAIIHKTELKTSVIRKPVLRIKKRRQFHTNNFLRGLIWYAWGLWQAFRYDFIDSR